MEGLPKDIQMIVYKSMYNDVLNQLMNMYRKTLMLRIVPYSEVHDRILHDSFMVMIDTRL